MLAGALAVCAKDLRIEARTREITVTAGFFAALVCVVASVAFYAGPDTTVRVAPGVLWVAITFASVLALGRTWQREREESALTGLLVSPLPRAGLFLGKALGVAIFMLLVEAIVVPLVALFFAVDLPRVIVPLGVVALLATVGVSATGTLFGAMTVKTRARDLVLASVLFPLLSPSLVSAVAATRELLAGASLAEIRDWLLLLGLFDALALAGGLGLFGALVDE